MITDFAASSKDEANIGPNSAKEAAGKGHEGEKEWATEHYKDALNALKGGKSKGTGKIHKKHKTSIGKATERHRKTSEKIGKHCESKKI